MNLFNLLDKTVSFGEKASDGFFTFLIGMVVIFGGMTVLILCVTAFGKLKDVKCGYKNTSCTGQLAIAVRKAYEEENR